MTFVGLVRKQKEAVDCSTTVDTCSISEMTALPVLPEMNGKDHRADLESCSSVGGSAIMKTRSPFSRAASYLGRRSQEKLRLKAISSEESTVFTAESYSIDDRFASGLNSCDASKLSDLRRTRADVAPIICCENEDNDSTDEALSLDRETYERGMRARFEALEIQKNLLGEDHSDVKFLRQHIGRAQSRLMSSSSWNDSRLYSNGGAETL